MSEIVRRNEKGAWVPLERGEAKVAAISKSAKIVFEDGRSETIEVHPYPVPISLDGKKVRDLVLAGTWGADDLARYDLRQAEPFALPEGKRRVGQPSYTEQDGKILEAFEIEDIPPDPDPPSDEQLFDEFARGLGMTPARFAKMVSAKLPENLFNGADPAAFDHDKDLNPGGSEKKT